ncbi:hypothetical protein OROGR_032994 [Orobanche gracilis]
MPSVPTVNVSRLIFISILLVQFQYSIQMAFSDLARQKPCRLSSMQSHSVLSVNRSVSGAIHHPASRQSGGLLKSISSSFGPMGVVVGILGGMVSVACLIGIHTAKQQLLHSPSVHLTKKRRECIPEVDNPDAVIQSADKFMSKSFLRKVGHIQDRHAHNMNEQARYGSTRSSPEVETLKSVGVGK